MSLSNYAATIVRLGPLTKHPNADRLQLANIFGNTVIVGLDSREGDVGIYFPIESQISEQFAAENDLIRRKDSEGKPAGGMLADNRRVRALKLRGVPSMGLWLSIDSLAYTDRQFIEGDTFEKVGEHEICCKYLPKRSNPGGPMKKEGRKPRESRIIPDQFRFHFDTAQLGRNLDKINPTDIIALTWKLHGTSAIVSNALVKKKIDIMSRFASMLGVKVQDSEYDYIYASRRVVKNEFVQAKVHFYSEDLWTRVGKEQFHGKLHHGETVYYEILGYTQDGAFIQKGYDYGCLNGEYKVYVYRITHTTPNGTVVELQWNQVKDRCAELAVTTVPELYHGRAAKYGAGSDNETWREDFLKVLKKSYVYDQDSQFCVNKVPEEGICVRKEGLNIEVYKLKSFRFLEHETKMLDQEVTDLETTQSE